MLQHNDGAQRNNEVKQTNLSDLIKKKKKKFPLQTSPNKFTKEVMNNLMNFSFFFLIQIETSGFTVWVVLGSLKIPISLILPSKIVSHYIHL